MSLSSLKTKKMGHLMVVKEEQGNMWVRAALFDLRFLP